MSRQNSAQNSVLERRLRPIYDWLDNGQNKRAHQEATKLLKKQPHLQCARVLLALALTRMGKEEEASEKLDAVLKENPIEDSVLQAMTIAYKELGQTEKICELYEKASQADPNNEEFLSHLFMAYVRVSNYKKQKDAAMALYKAKSKNPYYFWAVMSIVLQASNSDEQTARTLLLPLAEKLIEKMNIKQKIDQEQEIHLYLLVMELQHKYKEALAILDGPLGKQLEENTSFLDLVPTKRLEYLKKLDCWENVNSLSHTMLQASPDQWSLYQDYLTSVFNLLDQQEKGADYGDNLNVTLEEADKFILHQQENNPKCRGPPLARLELECRKIARNHPEADQDKLISLLMYYFENFSGKPVCFSDLKLFLPSLSVARQDSFFNQAEATLSEGEPKSVDDINRRASLYQLQHFLGFHAGLNDEALESLISHLEKHFEQSQSLVKKYRNTELRPSDMFLILAAQLLWQLWVQTSKDAYFHRGIVLLEYVLKLSPSNFHALFLLIKFYNKAAVGTASLKAYNSLELKHIQLDTLGHVMWPSIVNSWLFLDATSLFGNTLRFFTGNYKDTVEHIISAYRCGTFDKIREFIRMRDRLASSQHYHILTIERMLLDLLINTSDHERTVNDIDTFEICPAKDKTKWEELIDNRDFKAMISWDSPERSVTDEMISESFVLNQTHLRYRELTARSLVAAVHLSQQVSAGDGQNAASERDRKFSVLETLLEQIEQLQKDNQGLQTKYRNDSELKCLDLPVQGPPRPRLQFYLKNGHSDIFVLLQQCVLAAYQHKGQQSATIGELDKLLPQVTEAFKLLVTDMLEKIEADHMIIKREEIFEQILNTVESFGHACILLGCCHSLLTPISKSLGGKKNKKKSEGAVSPQLVQLLVSYNENLSSLEQELNRLCSGIDELQKVLTVSSLDALTVNKFSQMTLRDPKDPSIHIGFDAFQETLVENMNKSYSTAFDHMKAVTTRKKSYFSSLRLKT